MLRGYFRLYLLVSLAVSRRQEVEADRAAARVAGGYALASALRELPVLDAAWQFYLTTYVEPGLEAGYAPTDVLQGFPHLLEGRRNELAPLRHNPPAEASPWDSHPPIAQRIKLIKSEADPGAMADNRRSSALLDSPDQLFGAVEEKAFDFGDNVRIPIDSYAPLAIQYQLQREADRVFRAVARLTGVQGGLPAVLDAIASGWGPELARHLYPEAPADELAGRLRDTMQLLIELAAARSGAAAWRLSWSGPASLCLADGRPLDLSDIATQGIQPETVHAARAALARLRIDPAAVSIVEQKASTADARVLAGLVNVVVDGRRSDVVVLDTGLIIAPCMPRLKIRKAKPRMQQLLSGAAPDDLAGLAGSRFIAVEEIVSVHRRGRFPVRYELGLHDGGSVKIRWGLECEEVGEGWAALAQVLNSSAAADASREPVQASSMG